MGTHRQTLSVQIGTEPGCEAFLSEPGCEAFLSKPRCETFLSEPRFFSCSSRC